MENKFKITIPKPCHEDWNAMAPEENGRFCSVCTKGVVDFTNKTAKEIQEYFVQNQGQKICGRFKNEQVSRFDIQIPQSVLQQQMSFHKAFLLILFIVMGSTLFSCKSHDDASLGEVYVVEDTVQTTHTLGAPLPPKEYDSLVKEEEVDELINHAKNKKTGFLKPKQIKNIDSVVNETFVTGDIYFEPTVDSTKTEKK